MGSSIEQLLNELSNTTSDNVNKWCDEFCDYYITNGRHSYSEITKYVLNNEGGIDYAELILPRLKQVRNEVKDEEVKLSITKLIDHMQLEVIRYNFLYELITNTVEEKYIELNNEQLNGISDLMSTMGKQAAETNTLLSGYITQSEQLEKDLSDIHNEIDKVKKLSLYVKRLSLKAKKKVEDAQRESITILGIFAAIVLAFTGGMIFSSSVLENIAKASAYRMIIVVLIIGMVLINTVIALAMYLNHIVQSSAIPEEDSLGDKLKKAIGKHIFWITVNLIFVILIAVTFFGWEKSTEKSLQDKSNRYYMEKLSKDIDEINSSVSSN